MNLISIYNILKDKEPWLALSILFASIILWFIVLIGYFRKWIFQIFISKRNIERLKLKGVQHEAKILSAVKTSKPSSKFNTYELELSFKNLADTKITNKTTITDAKPLASAYASISANALQWYPTTINGSRERYSIQFNDDGSLKLFKQD